jgi:hypothetical protein
LSGNEKPLKRGTILCGLAFDNEDGHKRITTSEDFYVIGGSEKTHERLVEKVMEFREMIQKYGKKLENLSEAEYFDIVKEISPKKEKTFWFFHP